MARKLAAVIVTTVIAFESFGEAGEEPLDAIAKVTFLGGLCWRRRLRSISSRTAQSAGVDFLDGILPYVINQSGGFAIHL